MRATALTASSPSAARSAPAQAGRWPLLWTAALAAGLSATLWTVIVGLVAVSI